jgi:hypothetical protein
MKIFVMVALEIQSFFLNILNDDNITSIFNFLLVQPFFNVLVDEDF